MTSKITYGIKTLPENDPLIELTESGLKLFNDISVPGSYLVDIIPIRMLMSIKAKKSFMTLCSETCPSMGSRRWLSKESSRIQGKIEHGD